MGRRPARSRARGRRRMGAAPPPQAGLPPVLLLPDKGDDEMMAKAKRIAAEVRRA